MRARALAALVAVTVVAGCADGEDFGERPTEKKSRASAETEALAQARSVAGCYDAVKGEDPGRG